VWVVPSPEVTSFGVFTVFSLVLWVGNVGSDCGVMGLFAIPPDQGWDGSVAT
jgi:hypothetical protein